MAKSFENFKNFVILDFDQFFGKEKSTDKKEDIREIVWEDSKLHEKLIVEILPKCIVVIGSLVCKPEYLSVQDQRQSQEPEQSEWKDLKSFLRFPQFPPFVL